MENIDWEDSGKEVEVLPNSKQGGCSSDNEATWGCDGLRDAGEKAEAKTVRSSKEAIEIALAVPRPRGAGRSL